MTCPDCSRLQQRLDDFDQRLRAAESGLSGAVEPLLHLDLTLTEAQLLALLLKRVVVSRQTIEYVLWGDADNIANRKNLDVLINRLRKLLGSFANAPPAPRVSRQTRWDRKRNGRCPREPNQVIHTHVGTGYSIPAQYKPAIYAELKRRIAAAE